MCYRILLGFCSGYLSHSVHISRAMRCLHFYSPTIPKNTGALCASHLLMLLKQMKMIIPFCHCRNVSDRADLLDMLIILCAMQKIKLIFLCVVCVQMFDARAFYVILLKAFFWRSICGFSSDGTSNVFDSKCSKIELRARKPNRTGHNMNGICMLEHCNMNVNAHYKMNTNSTIRMDNSINRSTFS